MSLNKNMRVVIVDDYTTMLRILRNLLRQLEINNVEEATDGDSAFQLMQKAPPDLIISDWNMAPDTGLDLLRRVRAGKCHRKDECKEQKPVSLDIFHVQPASLPVIDHRTAATCAALASRLTRRLRRRFEGARSVIEKRHRVKPRNSNARRIAKMRLNSSAPVRSTSFVFISAWVQ